MNLIDQRVRHKAFGVGTVVSQNDKCIIVEFASKTIKFAYPSIDTFIKFLQAEEMTIQESLLQEIEEEKQAREARAKAKEAGRIE